MRARQNGTWSHTCRLRVAVPQAVTPLSGSTAWQQPEGPVDAEEPEWIESPSDPVIHAIVTTSCGGRRHKTLDTNVTSGFVNFVDPRWRVVARPVVARPPAVT